MLPSDDQAIQFVIMLQAGLPGEEALRYFLDSDDPAELMMVLRKWQGCRAVKRAQLALMGKAWQDMNLEERIDYALNQHYSSLAYLLFSENYSQANSIVKGKLDTARLALEAKKAGMAGKGDALSSFFEDLKSGKLSIKAPLVPRLN